MIVGRFFRIDPLNGMKRVMNHMRKIIRFLLLKRIKKLGYRIYTKRSLLFYRYLDVSILGHVAQSLFVRAGETVFVQGIS